MMIQEGKVVKLLADDMVRVEVMRQSACGRDCRTCAGGCAAAETQLLYVEAKNETGAKLGDYVVLEGESRKVLGMAALTYMLPLALFFVGFVVLSLFGVAEGMAIAGGGVGFLLGILAAIFYSRRMKKRQEKPFRIVLTLS